MEQGGAGGPRPMPWLPGVAVPAAPPLLLLGLRRLAELDLQHLLVGGDVADVAAVRLPAACARPPAAARPPADRRSAR